MDEDRPLQRACLPPCYKERDGSVDVPFPLDPLARDLLLQSKFLAELAIGLSVFRGGEIRLATADHTGSGVTSPKVVTCCFAQGRDLLFCCIELFYAAFTARSV
jgi:hypothetical protein